MSPTEGTYVDAQSYYFDTSRELPENYYCKWSVNLDSDFAYILAIKRSKAPEEQIALELYSRDTIKKIQDKDLRYKGTGRDFDQYVVEYQTNMIIHARSFFDTDDSDLEIHLTKAWATSILADIRARIYMIILSMTTCCCCFSVCVCLMRCRHRGGNDLCVECCCCCCP